jgi:hypothetical protein
MLKQRLDRGSLPRRRQLSADCNLNLATTRLRCFYLKHWMPQPSAKRTVMKNLLAFAAMGLVCLFGCSEAHPGQLRDGDVIFQTSRSTQSIAIEKATHSPYSHVGIIFLQDGKGYVYEAEETVRYTPVEKWVARGEGGHFVLKRLRDAGRILTPEALAKLRRAAAEFQGRPYDPTFAWSDDRIYCSELVWKIYDRALGIRLGRLQKLRDFDLSASLVKKELHERYGDRIPLDETVISPGEMFSSDRLVEVLQR